MCKLYDSKRWYRFLIFPYYFSRLVCVSGGEDQICLVDDAFAKICSMMNDLSIKVRTQAASLLGEFTDVSPDFLEQTLDKKLMSNLRVSFITITLLCLFDGIDY